MTTTCALIDALRCVCVQNTSKKFVYTGRRAELRYKIKLGEHQWGTGSAWYRTAKAT